MIDGTDSTIISNLPRDTGAILCYMDLRFRNDGAARAQFPKLSAAGRIITLTAATDLSADGIDCEPGNAGPRASAQWVAAKLARGAHRPVAYADLSDMRTLISELHLHGIPTPPPGPGRPTRLISAHPTGVRHICGPSTCGFPVDMDATQWWFSSIETPGGPDLDKDVFRDDFFGAPTPPTHTPHPITEADMIQPIVNQDGRIEVFVEKADTGEVFHAYQTAANAGWAGAEQNVRTVQWYSLGVPGK